MGARWTAEQIPRQEGRVAIVTGANSGLGLITARELARAGAKVVMACRDVTKGQAAVAEIEAVRPAGRVEVSALDLSDLTSVREFAERFRSEQDSLDILVNNAGVMASPRKLTKDGFELQFGTNHLGHFALTAHLLEAMTGREDARVVTVSSGAHRMGRMNFDDLQGERGYSRWGAYGQSKLANLLFAFELNRRLRVAGSTIKSVAAHPGYAATNLQVAAAPNPDRLFMAFSNRVFAQSAEMGALPLLYAATAANIEAGSYIGPDGFREMRGYPQVVQARPTAYDEDAARRLWQISEELTGVSFKIPEAAATAD
ncbi:MAG TPA: oxidoreductase [Dehalococcoidia bacterium]|nr:oxidoreductase [Dehalococcoidia bacterium]